MPNRRSRRHRRPRKPPKGNQQAGKPSEPVDLTGARRREREAEQYAADAADALEDLRGRAEAVGVPELAAVGDETLRAADYPLFNVTAARRLLAEPSVRRYMRTGEPTVRGGAAGVPLPSVGAVFDLALMATIERFDLPPMERVPGGEARDWLIRLLARSAVLVDVDGKSDELRVSGDLDRQDRYLQCGLLAVERLALAQLDDHPGSLQDPPSPQDHEHGYAPASVYASLLGEAVRLQVPELVSVPDEVLANYVPDEMRALVNEAEFDTLNVVGPEGAVFLIRAVGLAAIGHAHGMEDGCFHGLPGSPQHDSVVDLFTRCGFTIDAEVGGNSTEFDMGVDAAQLQHFHEVAMVAANRIGLLGHLTPEMQAIDPSPAYAEAVSDYRDLLARAAAADLEELVSVCDSHLLDNVPGELIEACQTTGEVDEVGLVATIAHAAAEHHAPMDHDHHVGPEQIEYMFVKLAHRVGIAPHQRMPAEETSVSFSAPDSDDDRAEVFRTAVALAIERVAGIGRYTLPVQSSADTTEL